MKLMVWKEDEGPTDLEFKQGDIFQAHDDTWEPGSEETLKWLVVQMEDYGGNVAELTAKEFTVGKNPNDR
ncbi:MAG TPA: hypothetical protein VK633_06400, partial [Verrucomicrobiae bacterium]|nr:hypothetical protein [Verrucomicrobiae bacterium]